MIFNTRPTCAEISIKALRHNYHLIKEAAGYRSMLAVVKADAYGHGVEIVAPALQSLGVDLFGVATAAEGVELRELGITLPVLVLGGLYPGEEALTVEYGLTPILFSRDGAERLQRFAKSAGVTIGYHLKVDSGMGRLGCIEDGLSDLLTCLKECDALSMVGFASHFALADEPGSAVTPAQEDRFRQMRKWVQDAGFTPTYFHQSNSAGLFSDNADECNLVRPGIALYGGAPSAAFRGKLDLKPVMRFATQIAQLKIVPAGTGISYGHHFVCTADTLLAALPVGYADGYNRGLTNRGEVLIHGTRAPIVGTICMDWVMVDVTDIAAVAVGDDVTLFGVDAQGNELSVDELADTLGTINYEIFCLIGKRVPRVCA